MPTPPGPCRQICVLPNVLDCGGTAKAIIWGRVLTSWPTERRGSLGTPELKALAANDLLRLILADG